MTDKADNISNEVAQCVSQFNEKYKTLTYENHNQEVLNIFNGTTWEDLTPRKLKQMLRNEFNLKGKPWVINSVLEDLKSATYSDGLKWQQIEQHHIPLKSYIWDCKEDKQIEYTPELMLRQKIERCDYEPQSSCPNWDKALFDWFNHDNVRDTGKETLLHEIIGYLLTQRCLLKKAFIFKGRKNTGKSLLGRVISEIVGEANVSSTKLASLNKDFGLASLPGKMLNIDDEPIVDSKYEISEAIFKTIINPEALTEINKKNKAQFTDRLFCKLLILANSLPMIHDEAALDRLIILTFENSIPEEQRDIYLLDKLRSEYPAIIAKSIRAFSDLVKRNYQFTMPKSSIQAIKEYKHESNPVLYWVETKTVKTDNLNDIIENETWSELYNQDQAAFNLPLRSNKEITTELNKLGVSIKPRYNPTKKTTTRHSVGYRLQS